MLRNFWSDLETCFQPPLVGLGAKTFPSRAKIDDHTNCQGGKDWHTDHWRGLYWSQACGIISEPIKGSHLKAFSLTCGAIVACLACLNHFEEELALINPDLRAQFFLLLDLSWVHENQLIGQMFDMNSAGSQNQRNSHNNRIFFGFHESRPFPKKCPSTSNKTYRIVDILY